MSADFHLPAVCISTTDAPARANDTADPTRSECPLMNPSTPASAYPALNRISRPVCRQSAFAQVVPVSHSPEQRAAIDPRLPQVTLNHPPRGFADIQRLAATFLIGLTGLDPERTPLDVPDIDRDHFGDTQQAIAHQVNQCRIPQSR